MCDYLARSSCTAPTDAVEWAAGALELGGCGQFLRHLGCTARAGAVEWAAGALQGGGLPCGRPSCGAQVLHGAAEQASQGGCAGLEGMGVLAAGLRRKFWDCLYRLFK